MNAKRIEICEHSADWANVFIKEKDILHSALAKEQIESQIFHVGSTSIKDLVAKPRIDMIIAVENYDAVIRGEQILLKLGYETKGEINIPFRIFLMKDAGVGFNLHLLEKNNNQIGLNLSFRDYLIKNDAQRKTYGELKKELAKKDAVKTEQSSTALHSYTLGKNGFITEVIKNCGFSLPRFQFCSHYLEKEAVLKLREKYFPNSKLSEFNNEEYVCFILYYKESVVGYCHVRKADDRKNSEILEFAVNDEPLACGLSELNGLGGLNERLADYFLKLCQRWFACNSYEKMYLNECLGYTELFSKNGYMKNEGKVYKDLNYDFQQHEKWEPA